MEGTGTTPEPHAVLALTHRYADQFSGGTDPTTLRSCSQVMMRMTNPLAIPTAPVDTQSRTVFNLNTTEPPAQQDPL